MERAGERPAWCSTLAAVTEPGKAELNAMIAAYRHWAR
jgi:hypothetical protein